MPPQMAEPELPAPTAVIARAVPTPVPAPETAAPIGRAVPTASVGVARTVAAESVPTPEAAAPKRRERGSDKAFVISDPKQDDAFVF